MNKVAVFIANGSEELEAVTLIDVLRRAELSVDVVSICPEGSLNILASRGVKLQADKHLEDIVSTEYQLLVLPGGVTGSEHFSDSPALIKLLRQRNSQQWLAAICAAPALVLYPHGLLDNAKITCYPSFWSQLPAAQLSQQRVEVSTAQKIVSSQGPGTAMELGLTLVEILSGKATAEELASSLLL